MNYRNQFGAENPADVFIPILISTFFASLVGLIIVAIYQKINLFNKVVLGYLLGLTAIIVGMLWYFTSLTPEQLQIQSSLISNIILFSIICGFIIMAMVKKVNVYEAFIDGAKDGFGIAIKIIPYLVAILVSIGVFRASGALDYGIEGLRWIFSLFLEDTRFVEGLPTAFMKPLSGTGARGMMLDAFDAYGVDSFIGRLTATLQGATDTTFYIIAVYFGSVGIKKTRYAVKAGLLADLAGIITAIIVAYLFFGHTSVTTNFSDQDVVSKFSNEWNQTHHTNWLSDDFIIYDQTYDTKHQEELEEVIPNLNIIHYHQIPEEHEVFVKSKVDDKIKAYKFTIDKQKIKSIQLLENFEK